MAKGFYQMNVGDYLRYRIAEMRAEIKDLIYGMEDRSHSPHELGFLGGRIAELNEQIKHLEHDLDDYKQEDDENF
ncbi:MAG: hypothetical protein ABF633_03475 [Clostridium sp.]